MALGVHLSRALSKKMGSVFLISLIHHLLTGIQPFTWATGTAKAIQNEFSWTNLSSLLYVEQPVGTGFSQGTPTAKVRATLLPQYGLYSHRVTRQNENDVAEQLVGFMQQFLEIFSELKGKNLYLTGESVSHVDLRAWAVSNRY